MLTEKQRDELKEMVQKLRKGGDITDATLEEFPVTRKELHIASSAGETHLICMEYGARRADRPVILNFHSGGFIAPRNRRDELFCRKMARQFQALVLDVDYKLAPKYMYPTAVNECWNVMKWVWDNREGLVYHPDKIVLMGHSSGGNLAAGICMKAGMQQKFRIRCAVFDYAPFDLVKDPADKPRTSCDMPAEAARDYNRKYIREDQASEPFASPLYAPDSLLERFPESLIISAGEDSLCAEDEAFALRLIQCGVCVTARRFADSIHGFIMNRMCEWEEAIALITKFLESNLG